MQRIERIMIAVLLIALAWVWNANAGSEPGGPTTAPAATNSYTIEDVYQRLTAGTDGSQAAFAEPSVTAGTGTMHTLNDVMGTAPVKDNTDGATAADVASGKKFWGLNIASGEWGPQTGTAGGSQTCSGTLNGTRWCDNGDGTVTDLTTNLVWLKKADWGGRHKIYQSGGSSVENAHDRASLLKAGVTDAELSDGSEEGDWRLPTLSELKALTTGDESVSSSQMRAFTGILSNYYWSSTTQSTRLHVSWIVGLTDGRVTDDFESTSYYVWAVRSGQ